MLEGAIESDVWEVSVVLVSSGSVVSVVLVSSGSAVVEGSGSAVVEGSGSEVVEGSGRKVVGGSGPGPVLTVLDSVEAVVGWVVVGLAVDVVLVA